MFAPFRGMVAPAVAVPVMPATPWLPTNTNVSGIEPSVMPSRIEKKTRVSTLSYTGKYACTAPAMDQQPVPQQPF